MARNRHFISYYEKNEKRCCINKCNSELYGGDISFHRFPSLKELQQKWLDAVPATQRLTESSVVCSQHFKPVDFHNVDSQRMLKAHVVPSIFPVICTVTVQPLPAKTTKRAARQRRDNIRAKVIFDTDPIERKENPHSQDTLSLAEDTNQSNEELTPPSKWKKKKMAGPEKVYRPAEAPGVQTPLDLEQELLWAGNVSAAPTGNKAEKNIQLTECCAQASQKVRSLVELVRQKDQTISDLQMQLRKYVGKHKDAWNIAMEEWNLEPLKRVIEPNRRMFVVQSNVMSR